MAVDLDRPDAAEFGPLFGKYMELVPEGDVVEFLERQLGDAQALMRGLPEKESLVKHAPYTWSIRQVVGHVTDCERVFGHRVLWMARKGDSPLSSFDENGFMASADFDRWPLRELLEEFELVRRSHLAMLHHLDGEAWGRGGTVAGRAMTVTAMVYVIAGHAKHHLEIVRKRLGAG